MLAIIPATTFHAELISELAAATFYDTYAAYNTAEDMELYSREHFNKQKIVEEINEPDVQYFLAYADDQPAGFVKMRNTQHPKLLLDTKHIEIERIYVLKKFQKQKVGAALIQHCIANAKEQGFEIIWLGVWQENSSAIAFYEKTGFEKFGSQSFLLGEDLQTDWLMKLKL